VATAEMQTENASLASSPESNEAHFLSRVDQPSTGGQRRPRRRKAPPQRARPAVRLPLEKDLVQLSQSTPVAQFGGAAELDRRRSLAAHGPASSGKTERLQSVHPVSSGPRSEGGVLPARLPEA